MLNLNYLFCVGFLDSLDTPSKKKKKKDSLGTSFLVDQNVRPDEKKKGKFNDFLYFSLCIFLMTYYRLQWLSHLIV